LTSSRCSHFLNMKENRKHPRFPIMIDLKIDGEKDTLTIGYNISKSGISFISTAKLDIGKSYSLHSQTLIDFKCNGKITWKEPMPEKPKMRRYGLEFFRPFVDPGFVEIVKVIGIKNINQSIDK